jgi:hypothetical protein
MKTKLMVSALLVALITGVAAAADPVGPKVVIINQKDAGIFKVIYEGAQVGNVNLSIANQEGDILYKETIRGVEGFIRPVNFKSLAAGEYSIVVSDSFGKVVQKVKYKMEQPETAIHIAKIEGDNRYLLSIEKGKDINVKIFDGFSNLVHSENRSVSGNLSLVYNLAAVAGKPTFQITDNSGNIKMIGF